MKYLVSIIMVLLMVNFFAQAEDKPDVASPLAPGATAVSVKDDIKRVVEPGSAYAGTMKGTPEVGNGPQGKTKKCLPGDARQRCNPSPASSANQTVGVGKKGKDGKVVDAAKAASAAK